MERRTALGAAAGLVGLIACSAAQAADAVGWGYEGQAGPGHWATLSAEFAACGSGAMQSPIDLAAVNLMAPVRIAQVYAPSPLVVLNNGHSVQFNMSNGSKLTADGIDYELLQVHFHTPSEHQVAGKAFPLEVQFVHKSKAGQLAVVGVMFSEGPANPALETLVRHMPMREAAAEFIGDAEIDPNGLLPEKRDLYRYMGSLTTPPCSEGVNWHVLSRAMTASKEQIAALGRAMGRNARPVQAPNNRLIVGPVR